MDDHLSCSEDSNGHKDSCSVLLEVTKNGSAGEWKGELIKDAEDSATAGNGAECPLSASQSTSNDVPNEEIQENTGERRHRCEEEHDKNLAYGGVEPLRQKITVGESGIYLLDANEPVLEPQENGVANENIEKGALIQIETTNQASFEVGFDVEEDKIRLRLSPIKKFDQHPQTLLTETDGNVEEDEIQSQLSPTKKFDGHPQILLAKTDGNVEADEIQSQLSPTKKFDGHPQIFLAETDGNDIELGTRPITPDKGEKYMSDFNVTQTLEDNIDVQCERSLSFPVDNRSSEGTFVNVCGGSPMSDNNIELCQDFESSATRCLKGKLGRGDITVNELNRDDIGSILDIKEEGGITRRENSEFETGSDTQEKSLHSHTCDKNLNSSVESSVQDLFHTDKPENENIQDSVFFRVTENVVEGAEMSEDEKLKSGKDNCQESIIQGQEGGANVRISEVSVSGISGLVSSSSKAVKVLAYPLCCPNEKSMVSEPLSRGEKGTLNLNLASSAVHETNNSIASSEEQCQQGSNYEKDGGSSMDSTANSGWKQVETTSQGVLEEVQSSSSEDSAYSPAHIQPPLQQRKKRIDLHHQFVREIVKIQHDREQCERQVQAQQSSSGLAHQGFSAGEFQELNIKGKVGLKHSRRDSEKVDVERSPAMQGVTHPDMLVRESQSYATSSKKSALTIHRTVKRPPQARGLSKYSNSQADQEFSKGGEENQHGIFGRNQNHQSMPIYQPPSAQDSFVSCFDEADNRVISANWVPNNDSPENSATSASDSFFPVAGSSKAGKERSAPKIVKRSSGERHVEQEAEYSTPETMGIKVTFDTHKLQRRIEFSDLAPPVHSGRRKKPTEYTGPVSRRVGNWEAGDLHSQVFDSSLASKGNNSHLVFDAPKTIEPVGQVENGFAMHRFSPQTSATAPFPTQSKRTSMEGPYSFSAIGGPAELSDNSQLGQHLFSQASMLAKPPNILKTSSADMLLRSYGDRSQLFKQADSGYMAQHYFHQSSNAVSAPIHSEVTSRENLSSNVNQKRRSAEQAGSSHMLQHSSLQNPIPVQFKATFAERPPSSISKEGSSSINAGGGSVTQHTYQYPFGSLLVPTPFNSRSSEKSSSSVIGNLESPEWIDAGYVQQNMPLQTLQNKTSIQFKGTSSERHSSSAIKKSKSATGLDRSKDKRQPRRKDKSKDNLSFSETLVKEMQSLHIPEATQAVQDVKESSINLFSQSTTLDDAKSQGKPGIGGAEELPDINRGSVHVQRPPVSSLSVENSMVRTNRLSGKWADVVDDSPESYECFGANSLWSNESSSPETGEAQAPYGFENSPSKSIIEYSGAALSKTSDQSTSKDVTSKGFRISGQDIGDIDRQGKVKLPKRNVHDHFGPSINETSSRKSVWERLGPQNVMGDSVLGLHPKVIDEQGVWSTGLTGFSSGRPSAAKVRSSFRSQAPVPSDFHGVSQASHGLQALSLLQNDKAGIIMGTHGDGEPTGVVVQAYKDSKQKRSKRELYVPRRGSPGFQI